MIFHSITRLPAILYDEAYQLLAILLQIVNSLPYLRSILKDI